MENNTVLEKKPLDYLKMVFRRKWLIIIPVAIGIAASVVAVNIMPKVYESSTLMLVEEGRVINPLIKGLAVSTNVGQRLAVLREQILGWDRINQLISKLNLAQGVNTPKEFEALVKRLRNNIKVKLYRKSIVRVSYQGQKPAEAMDIVKTITDIFIAENLKQQNSETENAISFINDQLALYQKKLKQSEISAMEDKLNALLVDSTEKHPMVIELREKIASAREDLERGDYETRDAAFLEQDKEMNALKEELKTLRKELTTSSLDSDRGGENRAKLASTTNEKLYKLLLIGSIEKTTAKDAGVNKKLYNELLQRLETAKITQRLEASKEGTRYIILDPARLPLDPIKPNKIMTLLMGIFCGFAAGIGLVFLAEMLDHSFLGADEAKAALDLPVIGAISKIITEADVRRRKIHNIKITFASILMGTALLVAVVFKMLLGS